ncbi:MAG TPA: cupin domain-containing protein [Chitinophagaceae bacterium]|nr:cupin domain-containing protein [Chitinophagaceae bacterium]HNC38892.1 cupin domain-containing protein [Chitinophagaceae bacterium]HNJ57076.1 cupin domain-containing protein [Chitinophagaceae bacterium]HNK62142.1 cupin domain-containing protein [Chitinophagaceae bacterium]
MTKINIKEKFSLFAEHWSPKIVGELNGQQVKLAKLKGEFVWHQHENEDELFMVVKGSLTIEFRDKAVAINENEFIIVPKNVAHKPVAKEEVWVLLFEPATTVNTGNANGKFTKENLERI